MLEKLRKNVRKVFWSFVPESEKESSSAIGFNFIFHWFPAKISEKSLSWGYSAWLGTISLALFVILAISGLVLMFIYVPSVERAYSSIKDMEYTVSYGLIIRRMHRWSAHFMVAFVVLHMIRVFVTGAYKYSKVSVRSYRPVNWLIGLGLLLFTMLLSYTGYLLPWDQLALWAITIGANIAKSIPIIGSQIQFVMQGGTIIDQNTLIIWYTLHIVFLPLLTTFLIAWHMWRIRKDGGLAVIESLPLEKVTEEPSQGKTYSLMGITKGIRPTVLHYKTMDTEVPSVPNLLSRAIIVFLFTFSFILFLAIFFAVPLEEPASLEWTPNPAKAPWYFLWLQELVAISTVQIGPLTINGGFLGGVILPGIIMTAAAVWPFFDKSPDSTIGIWFARLRMKQNLIFFIILGVIAILTIVGTFLRGPNWHFFLPWEAWPIHATPF